LLSQQQNPAWDQSKTWGGIPNYASYENVDDYPGQDDTSYNYSTSQGAIDELGLNGFSVPAGSTIVNVKIYLRAKTNYSGGDTIKGIIWMANGNSASQNGSFTNSFSEVVLTWTTNPNTGSAWTVNQVNGIDATNGLYCAGYQAGSLGSDWDDYVSRLYVEVNYTSAPTYDMTGGSIGDGSAPNGKIQGFSGLLGAIDGGSSPVNKKEVFASSAGSIIGGSSDSMFGHPQPGTKRGVVYATGLYGSYTYAGGEGSTVFVFVPAYTSLGGALVGGIAAVNFKQLFSSIAGSISDGAAPEQKIQNFIGINGAASGGTALKNIGYSYTATSGALDGSVAPEIQKVVFISSGGAIAGQSSLIQTYSFTSSAGAIDGGTALEFRNVSFISIGGAIAGESIPLQSYSFTSVGGAIDGGLAYLNKGYLWIPGAGAIIGGIVDFNQIVKAYGSLGAIAGGDSLFQFIMFLLSQSGAIAGGEGPYISKSFPFSMFDYIHLAKKSITLPLPEGDYNYRKVS